METARGLKGLAPSDEPLFVVVGVFDGIHLGHVYLLEHLVREAAARGARPTVITFDHHPDEILTGSAPPLLCDPDERVARLAEAGVAATVIVHFDMRLRETTYDAFIGQVSERAPIAGFLMTPDAAFGFQRAGTPDALAELGRTRGFEVVVLPPFELDGRPVRSSDIRAAIATGDVETAARLLGRPHAVVGEASPEDGGTTVKFELPVALPANGAYAATVDGTEREVRIEDGTVRVPGIATFGKTRVAFRAAG